MNNFNSVLKEELSTFYGLREATKSKTACYHDYHTLRIFDDYLCSINCQSKNLSEDQMIGWISNLS